MHSTRIDRDADDDDDDDDDGDSLGCIWCGMTYLADRQESLPGALCGVVVAVAILPCAGYCFVC